MTDAELIEMFNDALHARRGGDLPRAMEKCREILEHTGASTRKLAAAVNRELGYISFLVLGRAADGEVYFGEAARLSPRSELSSLGLFHALAAQGKWREALIEAVCYLENKDSGGYRELFCDGYGDSLDLEQEALLRRARGLLAGYAADGCARSR